MSSNIPKWVIVKQNLNSTINDPLVFVGDLGAAGIVDGKLPNGVAYTWTKRRKRNVRNKRYNMSVSMGVKIDDPNLMRVVAIADNLTNVYDRAAIYKTVREILEARVTVCEKQDGLMLCDGAGQIRFLDFKETILYKLFKVLPKRV